MAFVKPGSGWPGDLASPTTPIAATAEDVLRLSASCPDVDRVDARVSVCRACERLVGWREQVASEKKAAHVGDTYWGRPVAGFGSQKAKLLVVGLAPAAHGANRTGRMFTGDRSGDWLYAALHKAGLASQADSASAADGMKLIDTRITAPVHCAPPANKPTNDERDACQPWLIRELELMKHTLGAVLVLGAFGWNSTFTAMAKAGYQLPWKVPAFGHGVVAAVGPVTVVGCYHVSQQNTFTGKLTEAMLDDCVKRAAVAAKAGRYA